MQFRVRIRIKTPEWLEPATWCLGLSLLVYSGFYWGRSVFAQYEGERAFATAQTPGRKVLRQGDLVGRIEIPSLELSNIIFEGSDEPTLARGVGHVVSTALPGDMGNIVLAAHRDTFFRPLQRLNLGDEIVISTKSRAARYKINTIRVVDPDNTYVLRPSRVPIVTLITCYPFTYIGKAPKRYIVQGVLQSEGPRSIVVAQR